MTLFPLPPISQPVPAPKVETMGFLLALLLLPLYAGLSVTAPSCSRNVRIVGGNFTLSHGWTPGSLLTYTCPPGKYPYPVSSQLCNSNGQWKSPGTSVVTRVICKPMRCPAPVAFENGAYSPRLGSHPVGGNVSFECEDGYILRGSPVRRCRPNGMWDGETAICDSGAGHCPNPGIPIGSVRTGNRFSVGDRVKYRCSEKLIMIGSEERECQANRVWSGTEPICRSSYSYDFPEDVAPVLDTSFSQLLGATNPLMQKSENFGRRILIQRSGHLNLYLLLDSSQSVSTEDFAIFKESAQLMVDRIFSFDVNVSVGIVIFAKSPKVILSVTHKDSRDEMEIAKKLEDLKYGDPDIGTGTNINKAMMQIYEMMNNEMAIFGGRQKDWEKIRHVIILLTDGKSNMGGSPTEAVKKIKEVLNIRQERTDYLDIYAIGVGKLDVDWKELNELGSKKDGERHAFILPDSKALLQVFENMLDISKFVDTVCGVGNMSTNASAQERTPWHVIIKPSSTDTCRGALISDQWVLTAAHCFHKKNNIDLWRVIVGDPKSKRGREMQIEQWFIPEEFDVYAKKQQGIEEFYGNDIALLKLTEKVKMSSHARPICLPCTVGANLALRRSPASTCSDHENILLKKNEIPAHFVSLDDEIMDIVLKEENERTICLQAVSQAKEVFPNLTDVKEVVTDQFLCSGTGNDASPCKGVSSAPSEPNKTCPLEGIEIAGGSFQVLKDGQFLEYTCPPGYYPYPMKIRNCKPWGAWSALQTNTKKIVKKAECRAIQCPGPEDFENGDFWPRKRFYNISEEISFHCYDGYNLRGSVNRTCQSTGRWDGHTTICDNGDSFMYDTPEEVSAAFISSLTETIEGADADDEYSPGGQQNRKIVLDPAGSMNIYLVLDASDSIGKNNFTGAKKCLSSLIDKVASYGVEPRYAVVTYATEAKAVVKLSDKESSNADWVKQELEKIKYSDHRLKAGTNTKKALTMLYEMMILQESQNDINWNKTRHVIVLMTDGNYNMGGDPVAAIEQIREFLDIGRNRKNPRENYLDVYVFGIGPLVDQEKINALASKKDGEKHVFKVKDMEDLENVFYMMIDESKALSLCGIAWGRHKSGRHEAQPWHVSINVIRPSAGKESCKGAVVSEYYVLTAAHCFNVDDQAHNVKVDAGGVQNREVDSVYFHPDYDINRKKAEGIAEFYDYDIALVKLKKKFIFTKDLRPICLPCTEPTTRALRLPLSTTCQQHEKELLPEKNVKALFVFEDKNNLMQKEVYIKNGEMKASCERDALKAQGYEKVRDISDVVTPRFLCTGGSSPHADPNTCKGDSGGPLIIHKKSRFIQVGVISWGVVDVCKRPNKAIPSHARDFHVNLFQVLPWLREKLKDEDLAFL
uniref:Complement factor B n=1 Tax=Monodelphis domestica TaxID=13616 RepID=A0A5F8GHI0_MONDO